MGTHIENLDSIELLALSKFKAGTVTRELVKQGTYEVDTVLAIHGTITVGDDYTQQISPKLPWRSMFFAALSRMSGLERARFVGAVLDGWEAEPEPAVADEIKGYEEALLKKSEVMCKGKVTATLTAEGITNEAVLDSAVFS